MGQKPGIPTEGAVDKSGRHRRVDPEWLWGGREPEEAGGTGLADQVADCIAGCVV